MSERQSSQHSASGDAGPARHAGSSTSTDNTGRGSRFKAGPVAGEVQPAPGKRHEAPAREDRPVRRTRRARLRVSRVDPWSVMKTAFMFSIAGAIIIFVSVWALTGVVEASGVLSALEDTINGLIVAPGSDQQFHFKNYVDIWKILGFTALLSAANVVISTALATLFAFLYNLSAQVLGGIEVTLAED